MAEYKPPQARVSSSSSKNPSPSDKSAKDTLSPKRNGISESQKQEKDSFEFSGIVPSFTSSTKSLPPQLLRSYHKSIEEAREMAEPFGNSDSFLVISNVHHGTGMNRRRDFTHYEYNGTNNNKNPSSASIPPGLSSPAFNSAGRQDKKQQSGFEVDNPTATSGVNTSNGGKSDELDQDHRYDIFPSQSHTQKSKLKL